MREPQSWYDKSLLEDEPFLSAFKARQVAAPPDRRGVGVADEDDDARNKAVVKDIQKDMKLSKTVQAWLDLAFKPHVKDTTNTLSRVDVDKEPGMLCIFVQVYWALFQGDHESATSILQAEHGRRGFVYALDPLKLRGGKLVSTADLKKVHPKQTSQIGDGTFQSRSKKEPGSIPHHLKFKKKLNGKRDVPPDPQNTTVTYDVHKKRKARRINPRQPTNINEATSNCAMSPKLEPMSLTRGLKLGPLA